MKKTLKDGLTHTKNKGEAAHESMYLKSRALYFVNDPRLVRYNDYKDEMKTWTKIDLRFICSKIMKEGRLHGSKMYEKRAILLT